MNDEEGAHTHTHIDTWWVENSILRAKIEDAIKNLNNHTVPVIDDTDSKILKAAGNFIVDIMHAIKKKYISE